MIFFKIRNKKTGLYSKGGTDMLVSEDPRYPSRHWNKVGKTWTTRRALGGHLAQYVDVPYDDAKPSNVPIPEDWEIVEFETIEMKVVNAREYAIQHSGRIKDRNEKISRLTLNNPEYAEKLEERKKCL
jgi:hypothetical protein